MALSRLGTRSRPGDFTWPGFVDALASLLMVFVFVLMVFVLIQANLAYRVSGQDASLSRLRAELSTLTGLLNLEREATADLSSELAQTSQALFNLTDERNALLQQLEQARLTLNERDRAITTLESQLAANLSLQDALNNQLANLETLRDEQQAKLGDLQKLLDDEAARLLLAKTELTEKQRALAINQSELEDTRLTLEEREKRILVLEADLVRRETELNAAAAALAQANETISSRDTDLASANNASLEAKAEIDRLILAAASLQAELDELRALLTDKERESVADKIAIANLGRSLNNALASRVQELQRFRSEFFGQVRELLEGRADVQVVGDRFVFQSEVLFAPGQAQINPDGEQQLAQIGQALVDIASLIPSDIPWVLQVDGHTDNVPVTNVYADNWDLSTERALSVVRFFVAQGVPANRLAATGFGEFQPIDNADTPEARQRNRRIELKLTNRVRLDEQQ